MAADPAMFLVVTEVFLGGSDPHSGFKNLFLGQTPGFQCISVIATFNCQIREWDRPTVMSRIKLLEPTDKGQEGLYALGINIGKVIVAKRVGLCGN